MEFENFGFTIKERWKEGKRESNKINGFNYYETPLLKMAFYDGTCLFWKELRKGKEIKKVHL